MIPHVKYISLTVLVLQTTAIVLVLRYSRTVPQNGPRYLASTTILISEILKIISCLVVLYYECGWSLSSLKCLLFQEVWKKPIETLKLIVPAFLYTVQNNLLFIALSILDAATYQMPSDSSASAKVDKTVSSQFLGLLVVLIACFSSGFSGVYFEKIVKNSPQSLWIRNIQLALFSIILGSLAIFMQDSKAVSEHGFFQGYYTTTWIVILLQAFGGLVVSTVIKYADNILKGFATSVSIVLSTVCSYYLLGDFEPTDTFFMGATIVIVATMLYGYPLKKPDKYSSTSTREKGVEK
ncbi:UDP-N-acetylglucosamine transporter [Trichonephila clavipes]|nr:UDP-N-acetylglucosamine transporter [Trichonephila clavipes]